MLAAAGIVPLTTAMLAVLGLNWVTEQVPEAWWTYPRASRLGTVHGDYRRFATADAPAALLWGDLRDDARLPVRQRVQQKIWLSILLSLAIAALVAGAGEAIRRVRSGDDGNDGSDGDKS